MSKDPLYLIDSYALIYRSYFAFQGRPLNNPRGMNVGAAFGFFRYLYALLEERAPRLMACCFDPKGKTFRHEMYPEYKANRDKAPEDLHAQVPLVQEILMAMGIPSLTREGMEADDIIATLARACREEGRPCVVVSGDKDLLQLVGGLHVQLKPETSGGFRLMDEEAVRAEWGFGPELVLDYLSLTGDASDNVPGVMGIGDKTACKLLAEYGSLDGVYAALPGMKEGALKNKLETGREMAYFSRSLIALRDDLDLGLGSIEELALGECKGAEALFMREGMRTLAEKARKRAGGLFGAAASGPVGGDRHEAAPSSAETPAEGLAAKAWELGRYALLTDLTELAAFLAEAKKAGRLGFDTETESLDPHVALPVGFSMSLREGEARYVALKAPARDASSVMPEAETRRMLGAFFAEGDCLIVGHNLKYDLAVLRNWGVEVKAPLFDTMIAAWLLDSGSLSYSLEAVALRELNVKGVEYGEIVAKGASIADSPLDKVGPYACEDADFALKLYAKFAPRLESEGLMGIFKDVEMPLLPILRDMEEAGILLNPGELEAFGRELDVKLASIEKEIYGLVGHEFNISSTKQLREVLFVERKLAPTKKTGKGEWSTDSSVLEELAALDPVPERILAYRSLQKLKGTYVDALPALAAPDGRIRTSFSQTGAATGRLSSHDPNMQNIPVREEEGRRIRMAFRAPPGSKLVSADYSQIELAVLAHMADDPGLKAAFASGEDIHRRTASLIFGKPVEDVGADERRIAKTINFGVIYGMSAFRLSNELKIPRAQAQGFIDAYFATYSRVKDFIAKAVDEAERTGCVRTILGRKRRVEGIRSSNKNEKQAAERVATNSPIQGSAADIVKLAMLRVSSALREAGLSARMLLQVHDELILECPDGEVDALKALLKREMEAASPLSVPLRVQVEAADSWGSMH
jgi:DNA polymerase-1